MKPKEIDPPFLKSRLPSLDFLRGIAILLVLGRHILAIPSQLPPPVRIFLETWAKIGWVGVDLFFVLSGFLVSGLLFSEIKNGGCPDIVSFFIRRGIKIYPSFWMFLFISYLVSSAVNPSLWRGGKYTLAELLFLQNYWPGQWAHTWSLAVEEHFYLLLGLLLFFFARHKNLSRFVPFSLLLVFSIFLARWVKIFIIAGPPNSMFMRTHFRMDGLFFGALISYFYHFKFEFLKNLVTKHLKRLWLICLLFLSPPLFSRIENGRFINSIGFSMLYVGFGILLLLFLFQQSNQFLVGSRGGRILCGIGRDSYLTYLYHFPIYFWTLSLFVQAKLNSQAYYYVHILFYMGMSLVVGKILAEVFERPLLVWRDKTFPTASQRRFPTQS